MVFCRNISLQECFYLETTIIIDELLFITGHKLSTVQFAFMLSLSGLGWVAYFDLRTVPTIVTAHTFCASPDTRISYRQRLLIQGYFCAV